MTAIFSWSGTLMGTVLRQLIGFRLPGRAFVMQVYAFGVESVPVLFVSMAVISSMMVIEFSHHMKLVLTQDSLVPAFSTTLMVRELAPVLTGLLLACRVGAGIAAHVGLMRVTEQLDALSLMGMEPIGWVASPRWLAAVFSNVLLYIVGTGIALGAAVCFAASTLGIGPSEYLGTMMLFTRPGDLVGGIIKSLVFGALGGAIALFHGFHCRPSAEGVGQAATRSVVHSCVAILVADFLLTLLQSQLY